MLSRPGECIALTNFFLQRKEVDPAQMINSRQDFDHQELAKRYRTREQSQTAWQIQALCQANEGLTLPADTSINQAIKLAKRYHQPDAEAASLMIKAKLALIKQDTEQAETLLDEAGVLLTTKAPPSLKAALPLLQASVLLYQHRGDEARLAFEQIRVQAQQQGEYIQQAWANYLLGEYYLLLQQDELALSHYVETLELLGKRRQYYLKAMMLQSAFLKTI